MGFLLTVGLVYYQDFNRRQITVQGASDLKNNLRLAQSKALAGEKGDCEGTFGGYQVDFLSDEYVVSIICNDVPVEYRRYPLTGLAWADGPPYLIFKPLAQGVENPEGGSVEITLSSTSYSSKVIVDEGGEISTDNEVPYVPPPTPTLTPTPTPEQGSPPPEPTPTDTPIPTPTCVPEGEIKQIYLGGPDCCPGLTAIGSYQIDETGCHLLLGGQVCAYCPNGVCGLGENYCNCPEDCPSGGPTCIGGEFWGECGGDGCWLFYRRHWLNYEPDGCSDDDREEFNRCEFDFDCLF